MSTIVQASCPMCGVVQVEPADLSLAPTRTGWSYAFCCPRCSVTVRKPACDQVVSLLVGAGVVPEEVPAEALERHDGPPLTYDDLLDFCEALRGARRLARWAQQQ